MWPAGRVDLEAQPATQTTIVWQKWPESNDGYTYHDKVTRAHEGLQVLDYYSQRHSASGTPQEWETRIAEGQVTVNGEAVTASELIRAGQLLQYHRRPWKEPDCPRHLDVLFEDEHVLVVAKPAGLQVLPGPVFCQRTVLTLLAGHRRCPQLPSNRPVPVHRLGRGTSGVLLCACTKAAASSLSRDFATSSSGDEGPGSCTKVLQKRYRALVQGVPAEAQGVVQCPIGLVPYPAVSGGVFAASPTGKPAVSVWRAVHSVSPKGPTIVEVDIMTGRPHQIRIHMAHLGHPLVGDPLYGPGGTPKMTQGEGSCDGGGYGDCSAAVPGDCGYFLHSFCTTFTHPSTRQQLILVAPPPPQLQLPGESWDDHRCSSDSSSTGSGSRSSSRTGPGSFDGNARGSGSDSDTSSNGCT